MMQVGPRIAASAVLAATMLAFLSSTGVALADVGAPDTSPGPATAADHSGGPVRRMRPNTLALIHRWAFGVAVKWFVPLEAVCGRG